MRKINWETWNSIIQFENWENKVGSTENESENESESNENEPMRLQLGNHAHTIINDAVL